MKPTRIIIAALAAAIIALPAAEQANAYTDDGLTAEQLAKIAKTKARDAREGGVQPGGKDGQFGSDSSSDEDCGSVSIGNVQQDSSIPGVGGNVNNETIILGDVINVGNDC